MHNAGGEGGDKIATFDVVHFPWKYIVRLFVCFWRNSPQCARASSVTRFLDHTQRLTTVGRTPLDERSARRRDLYLTTHNPHNRQTSMPRWDSNPLSQQASGRRPTPLTARPLGSAWNYIIYVKYNTNWLAIRFYLLLNAPTCFGLTCWPSSMSFL